MKKVTFTFVGFSSDEVAQKFYTWVIDGGLEDSIIDTLSDDDVKIEGISDFNNDLLEIAIFSNQNTDEREITRIGNSKFNPANSVSSQDAIFLMQSKSNYGKMEPSEIQAFAAINVDSGKSESESANSTESSEPLDAYWGSYKGSKLEQVIGKENRIQITETDEYPWRCICSLLITTDDGNSFTGTGWLVSPRLLLTAAHCVYLHEHGGWAKQIEVIPGRNGVKRPFGSCICTKSNFRSLEGWTKKPTPSSDPDRNYDYGAIVLPEDFRYGDQLGYFGYGITSDSELIDIKTNLAGYPSEGNKPSGTLWFDSNVLLLSDSDVLKNVTTNEVLIYETDTGPGQSGAPVWITTQDCNYYGIGIHTNGDPTGNSATRINQEVYKNILLWVSEAP